MRTTCLCAPFLFVTQIYIPWEFIFMMDDESAFSIYSWRIDPGFELFTFCHLQFLSQQAVAITASKFGVLIQTGLHCYDCNFCPCFYCSFLVFQIIFFVDLWVTVAFPYEAVVLKVSQINSWLINSSPSLWRGRYHDRWNKETWGFCINTIT